MSGKNVHSVPPSDSTDITSSHDESEKSLPDAQPFNIHPRRPSALHESDLPEYVTYSCIKSTPKWGTHCTHFQLSMDDLDLFHTKLKSLNQTEPIPISSGKECHYTKDNDFYLLTNKTHEAFSLRAKNPKGKEIMILTMYQIVSIDEPKVVSITYNKSETSTEVVKLENQKPVLQTDGTWVLDFSERYTIPSKENAILVDEKTGKEMIVIRKVEENEIQLDSFEPIPPYIVFAVAVSFWLAPI